MSNATLDPKAAAVLEAWFDTAAATGPLDPKMDRWFGRDEAFDASLRERFTDDLAKAAAGGYVEWEATPEGALARVVLLDQFSRNIYREGPLAYRGDGEALAAAERMVANGFDAQINWHARPFVYLPFEHSESLPVQQRSVELFSQLATQGPDGTEKQAAMLVDYARKHQDVIVQFGRFPHRNEALGRESTDEERAFLKSGRGF